MATPIQIFPTKDDKSQLFLKPQQRRPQIFHNDSNDVYHIKPCYQPSVPKTKPSRCTTTRSTSATTNRHFNIASLTSCLLLHHSTNKMCGGGGVGDSSCSAGTPTMGRRQRHWLIVACVVLLFYATTTMSTTMAAPQSCILCDKNDLKAKDPHANYEEFLFEHQVTRQDAINALKQLNESFYEGLQSDSSCNAVRCTEKVNKYCLGPQFINDHCWCEFGHSTEGLPFVPHICYVGEKVYKASVGSCFFYEEVKECCCSSLLAKEWRHISSASSLHRNSTMFCNYFVLVITLLYLLIRRMHF